MARLTKRTVDAVEPAGTDQFFWDDELQALVCGLRKVGPRLSLSSTGTPTVAVDA
jgi:hypothetical protein